jgi:hypothetical protein
LILLVNKMDHVLEGIVRPGALDRRAVTVGMPSKRGAWGAWTDISIMQVDSRSSRTMLPDGTIRGIFPHRFGRFFEMIAE